MTPSQPVRTGLSGASSAFFGGRRRLPLPIRAPATLPTLDGTVVAGRMGSSNVIHLGCKGAAMAERARVMAWAALGVGMALGACAPARRATLAPKTSGRVVCLGDSITDGCTYPQLIVQALREAGRPAPTVVCAGVASDTAPQMAARVERTVLVFQPSLVTFSAGTNDALRGVSAEEYERALREIRARVRMQSAKGKRQSAKGREPAGMILLTPCIISPSRGADAAPRRQLLAHPLPALCVDRREGESNHGWHGWARIGAGRSTHCDEDVVDHEPAVVK